MPVQTPQQCVPIANCPRRNSLMSGHYGAEYTLIRKGQPAVVRRDMIKNNLIMSFTRRSKNMFQLKPGVGAIVTIGAKTPAGRQNIGKSVELFCPCQPGDEFINPVNGHVTISLKEAPRAPWLVTHDVVADGHNGLPGASRTFDAVKPRTDNCAVRRHDNHSSATCQHNGMVLASIFSGV